MLASPHLRLRLILLELFPRRLLTPGASGEPLRDMQDRYVLAFLIFLMILMGALLLLVEIYRS